MIGYIGYIYIYMTYIIAGIIGIATKPYIIYIGFIHIRFMSIAAAEYFYKILVDFLNRLMFY